MNNNHMTNEMTAAIEDVTIAAEAATAAINETRRLETMLQTAATIEQVTSTAHATALARMHMLRQAEEANAKPTLRIHGVDPT